MNARRQISTWLPTLLVIACVAGLYWWNLQIEPDLPSKPAPRPASTKPAESKPTEAKPAVPKPTATKRSEPVRHANPYVVRNVTVRDESGKIAYRGDVDLTATLARIRRGERLRFRNDGSTFQNRERRLPQQPSGYYTEYVHPTPGLDGPGPQRLVIGEAGEVYYTFDHYRSFRKIE